MPTLLTIDPGLRACGVALFEDGELLRAGAVRGPREGRGAPVWAALSAGVEAWLGAQAPGVVVVEQMQVHVRGKADPDDLLELAAVGGAIIGRLAAVGWVVESARAATWSGQVPSEIRRTRTQAWVEARGWTERADMDTTTRFQQDVWSAIGIGIWRLTGSW